jgi:activating signal cointegrator complex subunit 2
LDIFPDEDRQFVLSALRHTSVKGSAETLISALLEGNLSPDLLHLKEGGVVEDHETEEVYERRNVFDDDEMDFSQLRLGKKR